MKHDKYYEWGVHDNRSAGKECPQFHVFFKDTNAEYGVVIPIDTWREIVQSINEQIEELRK